MRSANALVLVLLMAAIACGRSPRHSASKPGTDAGEKVDANAPLAAFPDGGQRPNPYDFTPADPATPIPAQPEVPPKVATPDDAGIPPPPPPGCLVLEPGQMLTLEPQLVDTKLWQRIDPSAGCPASHVSDRSVAYLPFKLCPSQHARSVTIAMRGADLLSMPPTDAVADPLLVVYASESQLSQDPFECLGVNDNAEFDGVLRNSSRIDGLRVAANASVTVIATSVERPDQHGVGLFSLTLQAD